jgi:hypothetical protein
MENEAYFSRGKMGICYDMIGRKYLRPVYKHFDEK